MDETQVVKRRPAFTAIVAAFLIVLASLSTFGSPASAHADVNDFDIASFHADYELGRDADGRSTLHTTEHIVAVFPDFDQNRGMIRDLTRVHDGHDTDIDVVGVTDENGAPRDFETEKYGDFLSVTMAVPEGEFVHGEQHYVIEYTQHDVTRFFEDTGADEFYWDVNGTEWAQPFGTISATVTMDDELASQLDGNASCYRGLFGSTQQCGIVREGNSFSIDEQDFGPGENVTLALGFAPGTFTEAPQPIWKQIPVFGYAGIAGLVASLGGFFVAFVRGRRANVGHNVLPRYDPPEMLSIAVAAELLRAGKRTMTATLLDFAVRRKVDLRYDERNKIYGVRSITFQGLLPMERTTYNRLFGSFSGNSDAKPGETTWFTSTSTTLGDTAAATIKRAKVEVKKAGLLRSANGALITLIVLVLIAGTGLLVAQIALSWGQRPMVAAIIVGSLALVVIVPVIIYLLARPYRATKEGGRLIDHLTGLRAYMQLNDADRIRMMQAPSGPVLDDEGIVDVYERLLPYAVLFGIEDEWQRVLEPYYRESRPTWYEGHYNASDVFWIQHLATNVNSAKVTPPSPSVSSGSGSGGSFSSFSGGSFGGGFSGGGGGGGGGRGI
ncbi:DUF2207 domain-containing protein [Propionimicrobium sp. PCR01-08-3]|uniref:DUF2207 domain-containing protein n=1 Tax=Propionimicrobium sp. PCR01-08-3 TaxID=3052086 RepID=UPI00255CD7DC|nr:DUF2207 domain-containing protein [Propionimicrobium sp. PCR01-08-3]WIY83990.1 DUF2207 domain-containing protein [Propionimicrobium sp. PCR01-08-3]